LFRITIKKQDLLDCGNQLKDLTTDKEQLEQELVHLKKNLKKLGDKGMNFETLLKNDYDK
jgi:predicted RNase H-like nuclease (RuvC/YqgF family)